MSIMKTGLHYCAEHEIHYPIYCFKCYNIGVPAGFGVAAENHAAAQSTLSDADYNDLRMMTAELSGIMEHVAKKVRLMQTTIDRLIARR